MRIALISPAHGLRHILDLQYVREVFLGRSASTCMPLVLPLLASLTPAGVDLALIDEQTDAIDFDSPYDCVAITTITPCATRAYEIADEFRRRGVHVVMGGLHISLFPEEAAAHADTICVGEAENTWPLFLRDLAAHRPQPLYRSAEGADLSTYIAPRWDLIPSRRYRFFSIQASRGCCYDCDFCTVRAMYGKTRYKPVANLIREISTVKEQTKAWSDRFLLVDDNVFSDRAYARELLTALIPLRLEWECFAPLRIAEDEEMLALLRRSGCNRLSIGLESISSRSLASVHKGVNKVNDYKRQIARLHAHGLPIVGLFILGFDGDDEGIFRRTFDFVQETAIAFPVFSLLTPGPGTRLFDRMASEDRMLHTRWKEFDGTHVCFRPKLMSPEDLHSGYRWLYKQLYARDPIAHRVEALWRNGVARTARRQPLNQTLVSLILLKELVRLRRDGPDLLPHVRKTLSELWTKPRVDIVTLLLNLGLAEYVNQIPEPHRSF